jgi:hypothetical protein
MMWYICHGLVLIMCGTKFPQNKPSWYQSYGAVGFNNSYIGKVTCWHQIFESLRCNISQQHFVLYKIYIFCLSSVHVLTPLFFLRHNQNLPLKTISILMTRISAATINPPPPPLATAQSPKCCPRHLWGGAMAVAVVFLVVIVAAVAVVMAVTWQWPGWWLWG